jgi:D-amino-acid dehydrogenase
VRQLAAQAEQLGAQIKTHTTVTGMRIEAGKVIGVDTSAGPIMAEQVIVALGSWSPQLAQQLQINIPVQAGKGYSVTHPGPPALPSVCSLLNEARVAVTPMGGKLRIGGTMEIVGLDESVNRRRLHGILKSIGGYFPQLAEADFSGLEVWKGLRPCSPDGMPYIGRAGRRGNVVVATGHSMLGLSLAPVSGEMVADLVTGAAMKYDMALLDPDRY